MLYETVTAITLFKTRHGWQLSIRPAGEEGWSIRYISYEDAARVLALTNTFDDEPQPATPLRHTPSLEELGL